MSQTFLEFGSWTRGIHQQSVTLPPQGIDLLERYFAEKGLSLKVFIDDIVVGRLEGALFDVMTAAMDRQEAAATQADPRNT